MPVNPLLAGASPFAFGTWRFKSGMEDRLAECLAIAREFGVTHIDTADIYGVDEEFGLVERMLGTLRSQTPALFDGMTIATKIGIEPGSPYNQSPAYLRSALEASLERLGVGQIDLLYIHRPDNLTHPCDLGETLDGFVEGGLVSHIGVSNFTAWQVRALRVHMEAPVSAHQTEFSPLHVASVFDGIFDEAMVHETAIAAWSPLAGGRLFGSKTRMAERVIEVCEAMEEIAAAHDAGLADIAYAFVRQHPAGAIPILGTTRPERLRETLSAIPLELTRREWYTILEAALGHKMP